MTSRRRFLRALGATIGAGTCLPAGFGGIRAAMGAETPADHKALVCVFLDGGVDSNNLLIPSAGDLRARYESGRGRLALPLAQLHPVAPTNDARGFGLHPSCSGLARLFESEDLAFVCNVGTLDEPIPSRTAFMNHTVSVPAKLFSHNDQTTQWQTAIARGSSASGWGGRVAEHLHPVHNAGARVSMSVSLTGANRFQVSPSGSVNPFDVRPTGQAFMFGYGSQYVNALHADGSYKETIAGHRLHALDEMMRLSDGHLFEQTYSGVLDTARTAESGVRDALLAAEGIEIAQGFTIEDVFLSYGAVGLLADQLKQTARLIAGHAQMGHRRQLFLTRLGGFDTHQAQNPALLTLLDQVSRAMEAFQDVLGRLGVADGVVTYATSEFNRTFSPNSIAEDAGSDHAWGGHTFVMGKMVNGRKLYGAFPDLIVGDSLDVDQERGRWIPTTSVEQFVARLVRWFGATDPGIAAILPHLDRFDSPFDASANLDFLPA